MAGVHQSTGGGGGGAADEITFTPAGNLAAEDVQAALEELDSEKAATSHAHAASDITSGTLDDARVAESNVTQHANAVVAAGGAADATTWASPVLDRDLGTPPGSPTTGDRYIISDVGQAILEDRCFRYQGPFNRYMQVALAPTAFPLTLHYEFKVSNGTSNDVGGGMILFDGDDGNNYMIGVVPKNNGAIRVMHRNGGNTFTDVSSAFTPSTWVSCTIRFNASGHCKVTLEGTDVYSDTTARSWPSSKFDTLRVGGEGYGFDWGHYIEHGFPFVWYEELSDLQVEDLHDGADPLTVGTPHIGWIDLNQNSNVGPHEPAVGSGNLVQSHSDYFETSPTDPEVYGYAPGAGATGAWENHDFELAEWDGSAWTFVSPTEGTVCRVIDEDLHVVYDGSAWVTLASTISGITFAQLQAVSTNVLLGNDASGTTIEEIACTAAGRALLDDADAAAQRTTLGLDPVATLKSNLSASAAPGTGDDSADGYGVGSLWIDTTADVIYMCADASEGAAVWKQISNA